MMVRYSSLLITILLTYLSSDLGCVIYTFQALTSLSMKQSSNYLNSVKEPGTLQMFNKGISPLKQNKTEP